MWSGASRYALSHAAEHAAAAGRLDELLTDPEFLVHADPATLIPLLDEANGPEARRHAAVYRTSAHLHQQQEPDARRSILATDAARHRIPDLTATLRLPRPEPAWWPAWATASQIHRALRTTLDSATWVVAVACTTLEGRPVAVTGGHDGTVQAWDLTLGVPVGGPITGHT
ncbi:hypothetical protein SAMN04489712_14516, partial [Thermomonospora echinospora]